MAEPFTFNKDYRNYSQVEPYLPAFLARHAEIVAAGQYPYNDSFRGHIGCKAATQRDEDSAIYMLQTLKSLNELEAKVAERLADGWEVLSEEPTTTPKKYSGIAQYGWYVGGTGWREWADARLVLSDFGSRAVLPKGRRTHGHLLAGKVLVKR